MKTLFLLLLFPSIVLSQPYFEKITTGPIPTTSNSNQSSAWGDYDNDGDQDLVVTSFNYLCENCIYPILFYRNNNDGTFTRIFDNEIAALVTKSSGLGWGDYDNDGWLDLFICGTYNSKNMLFRNEGNNHFTRILNGSIVNDISSSQDCGWNDYDKDGWIDLFVTNAAYTGNGNFLYKNNGNGTFTKITSGSIVNNPAVSSGCAWGDYDNDGWDDVFVVNRDGQDDFLYHNNGDGTFTRIFNVPMVNDGQYGLACQWVDFDNDGLLDLFVTNSTYNNLYKNNGGGNFTTVYSPLGQEGSYGVNWGDYNNDGLIDIVLSNFVRNSSLYKNNGNSNFTKDNNEIINNEGSGALYGSWGDYNDDGKLDLVLAEIIKRSHN